LSRPHTTAVSGNPFLAPNRDLVTGVLAEGPPDRGVDGNLWVPSPGAMNQVWIGWRSTVPRTFTSPLVPRYLTDSGHTT